MPEVEVQEMAPAAPVSALVVPFTVPPALARVRKRWDYAAQTGIGPHVTILFPFTACDELGPPVRAELASIARSVPAFAVRFETVRRFPDLVWVEPEPAEPFVGLTTAIQSRWPDHPPYGGAFEEVVPHLTIVESQVVAIDAIETITRRSTPFSRRAERLELWCQDGSGRWRFCWRLPLGIRP